MDIKIVPGYDRKDEIRELFSEYTAALIEKNRAFAGYLALQNYDEELAHLQEKYGMPEGRLYLLLCDGKPAGCIALKKFSRDSCELKRLYVRPEYRGRGLAKRLARKGIEAAGEAGYRHILLDT